MDRELLNKEVDDLAKLLNEAGEVSQECLRRLRELRRRYPFAREVVDKFLAAGIDFRQKPR